MAYVHNDGGRAEAGFRSKTDCGIRAVAIACRFTYQESRKLLKEYASKGKQGNGAISKGIYKDDIDAALRSIGWVWVSAPKFDGRKARASDLAGTVIARMSHHYCAVIEGVIHDTFDSSHKMVYGYWKKA